MTKIYALLNEDGEAIDWGFGDIPDHAGDDFDPEEWDGDSETFDTYDEYDLFADLDAGEDPEKVRRLAQLCEGDEDAYCRAVAWSDLQGSDIGSLIEGAEHEDTYIHGVETLAEMAEQLVDEGCFGDVSDNLSGYIDYEAIGRDLRHDGYDYSETLGCVVEIRW